MTRVSPRTQFHSSKLIRCLADFGILDVTDPGNAFAEKLGLWIHFTDAITLSAVHNEGAASPRKIRPDRQHEEHAAARALLSAEFDRIRAGLMKSISQSFFSGSGKTHRQLPAPPLDLPAELAAAYPPYRRFYEAHQRDMELSIQPLRVNAREAVAKASPRLRQLAELDATFEKILRDREGKLLARIPLLLRKRFEQLFKEHQQKLFDPQQADKPAAWLTHFCNDMHMLLQAEADFRLQPTLGLIEAFNLDTQ